MGFFRVFRVWFLGFLGFFGFLGFLGFPGFLGFNARPPGVRIGEVVWDWGSGLVASEEIPSL